MNEEAKKVTDVIAYTSERKPDEWDNPLDSWILRFMNNCKAKAKNEKGQLTHCKLRKYLEQETTGH